MSTRGLSGRVWHLAPPVPSSYASALAPLPRLCSQLLYNRGISSPAQVHPFLRVNHSLLHDPLSLPDMDRAVARLQRALANGETVAVFGDFDADGISATALMIKTLTHLGSIVGPSRASRAIPYIPRRREEGHGLSRSALSSLHSQGASVIITTDCGVTDVAEAEEAAHLGMDLIITDHHIPGPEVPQALAVIDPKLSNSTYPFQGLAGVGLAYKLAKALYDSLDQTMPDELLELVAIGTIADLAPLTGENRFLVREGLRAMNTAPNTGLLALARTAGLAPGQLDAESVGFALAPRLNSSGRLDDSFTSYTLLMTSSEDEAYALAKVLDESNRERQRLTDEGLARAREQLARQGDPGPLIILDGPQYHPGVAGLVASRLAEEYNRPAIVVAVEPDISRGSARSIPDFHILEALSQCSDLFLRYGGHSQAAGFTMATASLPALGKRLLDVAGTRLQGMSLQPSLAIDAEAPMSSVPGEIYRFINSLEPFGQGNPRPVLLARGVQVLEARAIGSNGDHLRLKLREGKAVWDAIAFRQGSLQSPSERLTGKVDIAYTLRKGWANSGRPSNSLEIEVLDLARA